MSVYNLHGENVPPYTMNGVFCSVYDIYGNLVGDYNNATNDYQRSILSARNEWIEEARTDETIIPLIVHTDQHGQLTAYNPLFKYLEKAIRWEDVSACIGLGDVSEQQYISVYQAMETCLSGIPKNKQINIWGNHDTWSGDVELTEEELTVLNTYFNNSAYNGNHRYNKYGIEYMIDEVRKIKYVVIGGWEYDSDLGGKSCYVIGSDSMNYIIDMLSQVDGYDIVILSHVQPFAYQDWIHPPVEDVGELDSSNVVVNPAHTSIDQLLIDRQNKASGTVNDSYGNVHPYDFTECTSDILCCLAGHDHCDKYMWQNDNIPVYVFDSYLNTPQAFYFVNIDRTKERLNVWKVDDVPTVYNYQIPFNKPTTE